MLTNPETMEDDRIVAKCYVELGYVTKEKGEYDESLSYHRRSMEIFERIDDALSVADSHLNIAEIYKVKGEFKQAMSEYEKGLTLYEDVYVEDVNKNSDSGTDGSLTSSFSDPQHTRSLSKSDEILSQTTLINIIEKDIPLPSPQHPSNDVINTATSSLDLLDSSTKKVNEFEDVSQLTTNIDDSSLITSKKVTNEIGKLLSSGSKSDLQSVNTNNKILPLSPADLAYATIPEESDILEIGAPFLPPVESTDPLLLNTKLEDTNNSNVSYPCCFSN
jgi:tetratricopeptide (TPR) repeat protein